MNVVLIGMPGCGKSTVGVLLAKLLGMSFVDTDVVLQAQEGRKLQALIDEIGIDGFLRMEESAVARLDCRNTVIATGGSVVYGPRAMEHLHRDGIIVYIKLPFDELERRLSNLATRGVTLRAGQSLFDLYCERIPLYEAHADLVFESTGCDIEQTLAGIAAQLSEMMEG